VPDGFDIRGWVEARERENTTTKRESRGEQRRRN